MERRLAAILASDIVGYSALMSADETSTLTALQAARRDIFDPAYARHRGRVFKLMGDGTLVEFASVLAAVACAVEIQRHLAELHEQQRITPALRLRIGLHAGDVMVDGQDLYGDTINIAARLEAAAEAGGICVSQGVHDEVAGKLPLSFTSLGTLELKNITRPVAAWSIDIERPVSSTNLSQRVAFCRSVDGVRLAYARVGSGPPIVKTANWVNHLEYDWEAPVYRDLFRGLARGRELVRYDARGNGLSDWDVDHIDFDAFVADLEAVVDAAGVDRFPLFGLSQGCAVAIAYAVRHPERVSHLILHGGYAQGPLERSPAEAERQRALDLLLREGLAADGAAFRDMFAGLFIPSASKAMRDRFNALQRASIPVDNFMRFREVIGHIDVRHLLGQVRAPTLITHARGDQVSPIGQGRLLAAQIPGARLVTLASDNHVLLENEPALVRLLEEVDAFLATPAQSPLR